MKKIIVIVGIFVSCLLIGIGIFGLIQKNIDFPNNNNVNEGVLTLDYLNNELQKIKNAKNLSLKMQLNTDNQNENMFVETKVDLNTKESESKMLLMDVLAMHSYTVLEENILVDYSIIPMLGMSDWYKSSPSTSTTNYDTANLDIIIENINSFQLKNNVFIATLPKEVASRIIEMDEETETSEIIGDVLVQLKLEENNLEIILDFSNSIKQGENVYSKYILTLNYYDVGITKIIVPEDVKANAKTMGE